MLENEDTDWMEILQAALIESEKMSFPLTVFRVTYHHHLQFMARQLCHGQIVVL